MTAAPAGPDNQMILPSLIRNLHAGTGSSLLSDDDNSDADSLTHRTISSSLPQSRGPGTPVTSARHPDSAGVGEALLPPPPPRRPPQSSRREHREFQSSEAVVTSNGATVDF